LGVSITLWTNIFIKLTVHWQTYSHWRSIGGPIAKNIWEKFEILYDSTLTRACKPMNRSDSTILVTRLDQVMTRLDKISDDSNSKGSW